jgi:hypothetical protein
MYHNTRPSQRLWSLERKRLEIAQKEFNKEGGKDAILLKDKLLQGGGSSRKLGLKESTGGRLRVSWRGFHEKKTGGVLCSPEMWSLEKRRESVKSGVMPY